MAAQQHNPVAGEDPAWKKHDHKACIDQAVQDAEAICRRRGVRLTPVRKRVLRLIWSNHQPVGAYALLDMYRDYEPSAAPPTVYRALGFLMEQGLVHRIASQNAFVGCAHPTENHQGQFLICRSCGAASELHSDRAVQALTDDARALGFEIEHPTIELSGLCPQCQRQPQARQP